MLLQYLLYTLSLGSPALARTLSPSFAQGVQRRQALANYDPEDLSSIKKLAAIGDSYSAGIGAGERLGNPFSDPGAWACSRYNESYPNIINNHPFLGDPANRNFQFESCSGALTNDVKDKQLPRIDAGQDVILLSASGNDAELVDILNKCVYQFFVPTTQLLDQADKLGVLGILQNLGSSTFQFAWGCDTQLDNSEKLINDAAFSNNIAQLIDAAKGKLSPGGKLYYTGYAKFWDEAANDGDWCSKPENSWSISLGTVKHDILTDIMGIVAGNKVWQDQVVLTADRRKRMNSLVDLVNSKISAAVAAAGEQVMFINYDEYIGDIGGRFCPPDVQEPQPTRWNLGFYELDTTDPLGTSPFKRSGSTIPPGTFEDHINQLAQASFQAGNTYKDGSIPSNQNGNQLDPRSLALPDGYGRIFHPSTIGHTIIAEFVVWNMQKDQDHKNGFDDFGDPNGNIGYDQCPLLPAQKSPVCDMGQVSGVPYNILDDGQGHALYSGFCDNLHGLDRSIPYAETRDAHGNEIASVSKRMLHKRTPPSNPDNFNDYTFDFLWVKNKLSNQCLANCTGAFSSMAESACGHAGGEQNDLTNDATIDVGCGFYSWKVNGPAKKPVSSFAGGTCCFHLNETQSSCDDSKSDLFANVNLVDNSKKTIYTTSGGEQVRGLGIDINDPKGGGSFQGPLPYPVHMTGEHKNDYIQFSYNGLSWKSSDKTGSANCTAGGWDPHRPHCDRDDPFGDSTINPNRQMDCCFPC